MAGEPASVNGMQPVDGPRSVDGTQRDELLDRYRQLVDRELPAAARAGAWTLRLDHCFGRILLDDAVGGCWYDVLGRRGGPAYRRLDDRQLAHAVHQGERLLAEGDDLVRDLDARSLRWRGKPPKPEPSAPR